MTRTKSLSFDWHYGTAKFLVFAENFRIEGTHLACDCIAEPTDLKSHIVTITNPNFEQELHDECIRQYHSHMTDAAIHKIDQP